jgi:hypothetical protein
MGGRIAVNRAIKAMKSSAQRPIVLRTMRVYVPAQVPFADSIAAVTGRLEHLGDGAAGPVQAACIAGLARLLQHVADPRLVRVKSRQKTRARRTAAGSVIELREAQSASRQAVQVRRPYLSAIAADVGEAHIIREDQDNVRPRWHIDRFRSRHRANDNENLNNSKKSLHGAYPASA